MKKLATALVIVAAFAASATAAQKLYVQSKTANVMSAPSFKSDTVGTLNRGDEMDMVEEKDGWYNVTSKETKGWINRLNVSKNPPMDKVSVIDKSGDEIEGKARRRSSAVTSAAAARGLSEKERKRKSSQEDADFNSLRKLEGFTRQIPEGEVEKFDKAGEPEQSDSGAK